MKQRAQKEYCRIAQLQTRNERAIEVNKLEKDESFNQNHRTEFNNLVWGGNLHVPQIQVF